MRYGANDVLDGVAFQIDQGEVVALLGPNGAGKTTTIEILEGFRARSAGRVAVFGVDPMEATEDWRARVGIVLQSWRDHARWTPLMLISQLGRFYEPYSTPERRRPFEPSELIAMVGLQDQAEQKIRTLSGGERRRLDVAVGLVGRPELVFLDEPTAGFDPQAKRDFQDMVQNLTDAGDTTILLTTHDLSEAERLADRIMILTSGRIVANGSPDELTRSMSRDADVRWSRDGEKHRASTPDATRFVRELLASHGDEIGDLEVRRATLEDTYLDMVQKFEGGRRDEALTGFEEPSS
jgi:ABC-2 type transport system ATP-binding protein